MKKSIIVLLALHVEYYQGLEKRFNLERNKKKIRKKQYTDVHFDGARN